MLKGIMIKILTGALLIVFLATPALAADSNHLLRQAGQAGKTGVMRNTNGKRLGTVESQGRDVKVIRDASGNRVGQWSAGGMVGLCGTVQATGLGALRPNERPPAAGRQFGTCLAHR